MDFSKVLLKLNKLNSDIYLGGFTSEGLNSYVNGTKFRCQKFHFFPSKNLNIFISSKVSYFLFGKRYDRSARIKLRELSS